MKKLLCWVLTVMLCFSMSSVFVYASESFSSKLEASEDENEVLLDVSEEDEDSYQELVDNEDEPALITDSVELSDGDESGDSEQESIEDEVFDEPYYSSDTDDIEEPVIDGANGAVLISTDYFPDPVFQHYVLDNFDKNGDQWLDTDEMAAVTVIDLSFRFTISSTSGSVFSVKGIEYFPNLRWLDCSDNALKELDVSNNPKLEYLDVGKDYMAGLKPNKDGEILQNHRNELKTLDVSHNPNLTTLICDYNYLQALDVSNNLALEVLYCRNNQLTTLHVRNNLELKHLRCENNKLTTLDVSRNTKLEWIWTYGNQIKSLDLSKCPTLAEIAEANNTRIDDLDGITATSYLWDIGEEFLATPIVCDYGTTIIYKDARLTGDADGDGTVSRADRTYLARYLAKWPDYSEIDVKAADVNKDGIVNRADRTYLARHLAKWPDYPLT